MRHKLMQNSTEWGKAPDGNARKSPILSPMTGPSRSQTKPKNQAVRRAQISFSTEARAVNTQVASNPSSDLSPPTPLKASITTRDWTLEGLIAKGKRFREIPRVSAQQSGDVLKGTIEKHEQSGVPLIIEGWHKHHKWSSDIFDVHWLEKHHGNDTILTRNVHDRRDKELPVAEFLNKCRETEPFAKPDETERLYGKDAACPPQWKDWLDSRVLPASLLPSGDNDLMQHLPRSGEVESLLCYHGVGDTFTPCHKDLCGSSGHNLMCYSEKGGSSFWFMTASQTAPEVADYFQSELGQELDWEGHVATVNELARAPFPVYIGEQKLGDLILVPPRSCHQVVNYGGLTMKISWSRMTVRGLGIALHYELPIYRRVCRPEQYRVKSVLYRSLLYYTSRLNIAMSRRAIPTARLSSRQTSDINMSLGDYGSSEEDDVPIASVLHPPAELSPLHVHDSQKSRFVDALQSLLTLFDEVLVDEYAQEHASFPHIFGKSTMEYSQPSTPPWRKGTEGETYSCTIACDFCGADIFQSFFECQTCVPEGAARPTALGDGLLICAPCYVEGRSCSCTKMAPVQCCPFELLLEKRNRAAAVLRQFETHTTSHKVRNTKLEESDLLADEDHIAIFTAACALLKLRREGGPKLAELRSCKISLGNRHKVPRLSSIHCGPCHDSTCFEHILLKGIHCAEALLVITRGHEQNEWHEFHKRSRITFTQGKPNLEEAEKTGGLSRLKDRLVLAAQRYRTCRPIMERYTRRGWYDCETQESTIDEVAGLGSPLPSIAPPSSETSSPEPKAIGAAPSEQLRKPSIERSNIFPCEDDEPLSDLSDIESTGTDHPVPSNVHTAPQPPTVSRMSSPMSISSSGCELLTVAAESELKPDKETDVVYVSVPTVKAGDRRKKRRSSPTPEISRKKPKRQPSPQKDHALDADASRPSTSRPEHDDNDTVGGNYGNQLALAIQSAHTNQTRQSPLVNIRGSRRRILSPDSREPTPLVPTQATKRTTVPPEAINVPQPLALRQTADAMSEGEQNSKTNSSIRARRGRPPGIRHRGLSKEKSQASTPVPKTHQHGKRSLVVKVTSSAGRPEASQPKERIHQSHELRPSQEAIEIQVDHTRPGRSQDVSERHATFDGLEQSTLANDLEKSPETQQKNEAEQIADLRTIVQEQALLIRQQAEYIAALLRVQIKRDGISNTSETFAHESQSANPRLAGAMDNDQLRVLIKEAVRKVLREESAASDPLHAQHLSRIHQIPPSQVGQSTPSRPGENTPSSLHDRAASSSSSADDRAQQWSIYHDQDRIYPPRTWTVDSLDSSLASRAIHHTIRHDEPFTKREYNLAQYHPSFTPRERLVEADARFRQSPYWVPPHHARRISTNSELAAIDQDLYDTYAGYGTDTRGLHHPELEMSSPSRLARRTRNFPHYVGASRVPSVALPHSVGRTSSESHRDHESAIRNARDNNGSSTNVAPEAPDTDPAACD